MRTAQKVGISQDSVTVSAATSFSTDLHSVQWMKPLPLPISARRYLKESDDRFRRLDLPVMKWNEMPFQLILQLTYVLNGCPNPRSPSVIDIYYMTIGFEMQKKRKNKIQAQGNGIQRCSKSILQRVDYRSCSVRFQNCLGSFQMYYGLLRLIHSFYLKHGRHIWPPLSI